MAVCVYVGSCVCMDACVHVSHMMCVPVLAVHVCYIPFFTHHFHAVCEEWDVCMYVCVYVYMLCLYVWFYVCMYVCMYVCVYLCIHVCVYVCTHVCMHCNGLISLTTESTYVHTS